MFLGHRLRIALTTALILAASFATVPPATAQQFETDPHTLLLAHFDETARRADYAAGIQELAGIGARLVDGYYGKAADLRFPQYASDFLTSCDDYAPEFRNFGFYERGNVDQRQGTLEFWFRTPAPSNPRVPSYTGMLNAILARNAIQPDDKFYSSLWFDLTARRLSYVFPLLSGDYFKGEVPLSAAPGFSPLDPEDWHHLAICWSPGELIVWLDGRPLVSHDMTGKFGLAIASNPVRFVAMAECVLDELRISNVVRYPDPFEPRWRDGQRAEYAFPGNPAIQRFPMKLEPPYVPATVPAAQTPDPVEVRFDNLVCRFDRATGYLAGWTMGERSADRNLGGVMLWEGLQRQWLPGAKATEWNPGQNMLSFRQNFDGVAVVHELMGKEGVVRWDVQLRNHRDREIWLEVLLGLPLPMAKVDQYFDGTGVKSELSVPRRKETPASTLPFVAASGEGIALGVGIDPHICLHAIPCEWIPESASGTIRQGAKIALAPQERYTYSFVIVTTDRADFGPLNAVDRFHQQFPDLYRFRPDVPVYSYMPTGNYAESDPFVEIKRLCYIGGFWGHGPGHSKGNEYGSPQFWNNPKYDEFPSYEYCRRIEKSWGSLENLHELITAYNRRSFDNYYPVRRSHICPDLTPRHLIHELWPGYRPSGDPACVGQYYAPIGDLWMTNEYDTPLGRYFIDQTLKYFAKKKGYSPGWINDMSHVPIMRAADEVAKRTPGRAFSHDLGTYVLRTLGRQARYEEINKLVHDGHRMSIWSDGGSFSYTLCAFSVATAVEGGVRYTETAGNGDTLAVARVLLGEKPITVLNDYARSESIGRYHQPEEFTARTLRDYYRYLDAQLTLFCLRNGITLDSTYLTGRQESMERAPLLVESTVLGRQLLPGGSVEPPFWLVRAGRGLESLLVIGNEKPSARSSDIRLIDHYFSGTPLFGPFYGGRLAHEFRAGTTTIPGVAVEPRGVAAFKMLACLQGGTEGKAVTKFSGDGIVLRAEIELEATQPGRLRLNPFSPMYEIRSLTVAGKPVPLDPRQALEIQAGRTVLTAEYRNRALCFAPEDWDAVELIQNGRTNFCVVADQGFSAQYQGRAFALGFERGTAMMLNEFVAMLDEEDGRSGSPAQAALVEKTPDDFSGWTVALVEDRDLRGGRVRIERPGRRVLVEGPTQGEIRRAMVVLLRLMDRKYPHVGRFLPPLDYRLKWYLEEGKMPWEAWEMREDTKAFFARFEDKLWLVKPILRPEYESLYSGGNTDFTGKYQLRWSPYLFEPTYADDFVYGHP